MKSIVVTKIRFSKHCISVSGIYDGEGFEAMLYRHSDHSWHPDPETREKGERFMEALQRQMFSTLTPKPAKPEKHRPRDTWFG